MVTRPDLALSHRRRPDGPRRDPTGDAIMRGLQMQPEGQYDGKMPAIAARYLG